MNKCLEHLVVSTKAALESQLSSGSAYYRSFQFSRQVSSRSTYKLKHTKPELFMFSSSRTRVLRIKHDPKMEEETGSFGKFHELFSN